MTDVTQVLAAIDLTDEAPQVLEEARQIAAARGAKLSVITVVRPVFYGYAGMETGWLSKDMANYETEAEKYARKRVAELASAVGVKASDTYVSIGSPAPGIKHKAKEMGADLIVLGTHGRHGLGLMLGSTATGVLHGAACDVLAVKVETEEAAAA